MIAVTFASVVGWFVLIGLALVGAWQLFIGWPFQIDEQRLDEAEEDWVERERRRRRRKRAAERSRRRRSAA